MIKMLQIGMTVKVLPDAEYGGKYTGCVGVVKNYYSSKKKAAVVKKLFGSTTHAKKVLGEVVQVQ